MEEERIGGEEDGLIILVVGDGDCVSYAPVNLLNIHALTFRLAKAAGGVIELHLDSPDGPVLATVEVPAAISEPSAASSSSAGESSVEWIERTVPISNPGGTHTLFLVFEFLVFDGLEEGPLLRLDRMTFEGRGIMR